MYGGILSLTYSHVYHYITLHYITSWWDFVMVGMCWVTSITITITKPSRRSHLCSWVELDNWHLVTVRRKSTCRFIHLLNKPSGKACTRWCWPARWAPPLVPATLSLCHPRWHRPHGSCWKGQSQSRECFPEKEDFMKMKDEDKENDPVDERGVDSIRQPPSFWRLKNNKFASGTWKNQSTQILGNIKRHIITSKWNRNPVNVGFDKIALWRHWLAQVFQVLEHLRLSHRCPLREGLPVQMLPKCRHCLN